MRNFENPHYGGTAENEIDLNPVSQVVVDTSSQADYILSLAANDERNNTLHLKRMSYEEMKLANRL